MGHVFEKIGSLIWSGGGFTRRIVGYGSINIRHCMWEKTYERFAIKKNVGYKMWSMRTT